MGIFGFLKGKKSDAQVADGKCRVDSMGVTYGASIVAFSDLESVAIQTTNAGPPGPDVFWVLTTASGVVKVPQGADGEEQLVDKLTALPDFNFESMIEAASCTENRLFTCWSKGV